MTAVLGTLIALSGYFEWRRGDQDGLQTKAKIGVLVLGLGLFIMSLGVIVACYAHPSHVYSRLQPEYPWSDWVEAFVWAVILEAVGGWLALLGLLPIARRRRPRTVRSDGTTVSP